MSMLTHSLSHLPSRFRRHQSVCGPENRLVLKLGQKRDQAISIPFNLHFSKYFFVLSQTNEIQDHDWKNSIACL